MFKAPLFSTLFAAVSIQAVAEPISRYDISGLPPDVAARVIMLEQYGDRFDAVIKGTLAEWSKPGYAPQETDYDLSILPPDIAAHVVELMTYGDRFDAVVRGVFIENMKPTWAVADCGHEADRKCQTGPDS